MVMSFFKKSDNLFGLNSSRYFTRKYSDSNKNKTSNDDIAFEAEYYYKQVILNK